MADIDTDTISLGIDLGHFWVSVSVPVSTWRETEYRYQSRYRLGGKLSISISPGLDLGYQYQSRYRPLGIEFAWYFYAISQWQYIPISLHTTYYFMAVVMTCTAHWGRFFRFSTSTGRGFWYQIPNQHAKSFKMRYYLLCEGDKIFIVVKMRT